MVRNRVRVAEYFKFTVLFHHEHHFYMHLLYHYDMDSNTLIIKAKDVTNLLWMITSKVNANTIAIYINKRPSLPIILELLNKAPNLKVIYLPPSIYLSTSKRIINSLKSVNVVVKPITVKKGRPPKYTHIHQSKIMELRRLGYSISEISSKTGIPRRSIYYLLKSLSLHNHVKAQQQRF